MAATILLVDDEHHIRSALRRSLRDGEYEILDVASGKEALAILKARSVDIIISDHAMPEMTGVEFLKRARILRPECIRIVLSGRAELDMAITAINEDAVHRFLLKPWDGIDLQVMIEHSLRHLQMIRENARLSELVRKYEQMISKLVTRDGRAAVRRDQDGAIVIEDDSGDAQR